MFMRFVISRRDLDSGRRQGLFQAGRDLLARGELSRGEVDAIDEIRVWFGTHLEAPTRLSLSARPNRKGQALSWFRATATEHIGRMREYQLILEGHGIPVETLTTERPGYIVYEDEHQVAAYPFADTPC